MFMVGVSNLPTSGSFTEEDMTMKMIGLSQKIPYAGQKGLESKAAKSQAEAATADRRQTELDLATAARNAYLSLYFRQKALDYISAQREIQQDIVSSVVAKLQTNQASQADVAAALITIVRGIQAAPRYILAKGGITSNDVAAKALGVQRAVVAGQIIPGVPVWRLGEDSRFPGMSYIVFPGNVGTETSMTDVVQTLRGG